ncbi:APC family permease [Anaerovorax odorimutans]|uniref:APC family permease n=1 Tax=Anaerovorax odorimutans TaxID=109327 RepID=UPI0003FCE508|nr:amino acid permease [Anaerovorax odorimutans]
MNERQSLRRVLGRTDVIALAIGTMIGWGWIMLAGNWVSQAGLIGAIGAFVTGAAFCLLVGVTYAELTAALPIAGGEMVFAYRALGYKFSWFASWTVALAYLGVAAWEGIAIATAIDYIIPLPNFVTLWSVSGDPVSLPWAVVGAFCTLLLSILNHFGARPTAIFQVMATSAIILVGFMFFFGGIAYGDVENIGVFITDKIGYFAVLMIVPSMLIGFDIIPQSAEEMNLPRREIGKVLMASILLGAGWYILMMIGISLSAPEEIRNTTPIPIADCMAYAFGEKGFGDLLILGGICAILTSWNGFMMGATRIIFAMGRARMLPKAFGELHPKYNTPTAAIWLVAIISAGGSLLGKNALLWLVHVSAFEGVLAYLTVSISFLLIRKNEPDLNRPFKTHFGILIGNFVMIGAIIFVCMFIISSPISLQWPYEWMIILLWYMLGVIFTFIAIKKDKVTTPIREILIFGDVYARKEKL